MKKRRMSADQRLLLGISAVMLVLIVTASLLAPQSAQNDPRPTTYNTGPQGAKAAYLLLQRLGVSTMRWERPIADLNSLDAPHTTLILADPLYAATDEKELAAEVKRFLERGGHVLATGDSGALLLPDGSAKSAGMLQPGLCTTTPAGPGPLARAGAVEMANHGQWASDDARFRVAQRCGDDAVVVRYAVDGPSGVQGEAVWWSSATPLTNAGLEQDGDLRLLLASVGHSRAVVFDESLHRATASMWDAAKGLPLGWLTLQVGTVFVLLVLSFSRRRGPVRSPVMLPRSSPLEFAESMGDLYEKGGATSAATEAERRRLLRVLTREVGIPHAVAELGAETVAEALRDRLGGDWTRVAEHMRGAEEARHSKISPRSALALVRALSEDADAVRQAVTPIGRRVEAAANKDAIEELELAKKRERV